MGSDSDNSPLQPPAAGQDTAQEVLGGFPRHLTQQLIDEEQRSAARFLGLAPWLVGAGLTALALASPQEALVGGGPRLIQAWSSGAPPGEAYSAYWLVKGLARASGLGLEPAAFLLSALFYGACVPLLAALGRRVGLSASSALTVTLIVLLSPAAWLAATTPGPEAAGLWASALLFSLVWRAREVGSSTSHRLLALGLLALGAGLSPSLAWLLPAVAFALAEHKDNSNRTQRAIKWGFIGALLLGSSYALLSGQLTAESPPQAPTALGVPGVLAGTEGSGLGGAAWRALSLLPALGLSLLGLGALCFEPRNESEEPPPRWLLGWALLPFMGLALSGGLRELPYLYLLPLAALGGFDFLGRREDELDARLVLGSVLLAFVGLLGSVQLLRSSDPQADWRAHARRVLEPDDLVLSPDATHRYLLGTRWGLEVLPLSAGEEVSPQLEQAREAGRRVVVEDLSGVLAPVPGGRSPLSELSSSER